jgi:hypothetical protein
MKCNPITPSTFDAVAQPRLRLDELWGQPAIGRALGVSDDTIRRWLADPAIGLPVRKVGGRWFGLRSELEAWRRGA